MRPTRWRSSRPSSGSAPSSTPAWAIVAAVLIFVPHLVIDDGRIVGLYLAASSASTGSTSGSRPRSTSPSTCCRCGSSRCWWARREPAPLGSRACCCSWRRSSRSAPGCLSGAPTRCAARAARRRRALLRPRHAGPAEDVVIVGIDEKTLSRPRTGSIPLDRARHAEVIDALNQGRREGDRLRRRVHRAEADEEADTRALRVGACQRRASCSGPPRSRPRRPHLRRRRRR